MAVSLIKLIRANVSSLFGSVECKRTAMLIRSHLGPAHTPYYPYTFLTMFLKIKADLIKLTQKEKVG